MKIAFGRRWSLSVNVCVLMSICMFPTAAACAELQDYVTAKRRYVEALARAIGASSIGPYRLVAVTGPAWQIGDAIDLENSLNILTERCRIPVAKLPKPPRDWSTLPGLSQQSAINFAAGLPDKVVKLFGKDSKIGVSFDLRRSGRFVMRDLQSTIVAQDTFEASLTKQCRDVLALRGAMVVRGVITGKEVFNSGGSISTGADLKVVNSELLTVKYDSKGNFEVEDQIPTAKMFLVAVFPKQTRSGDDLVRRAPTAEEIAKLEATIVVP